MASNRVSVSGPAKHIQANVRESLYSVAQTVAKQKNEVRRDNMQSDSRKEIFTLRPRLRSPPCKGRRGSDRAGSPVRV